ncbi:MAG: tyrosine-type recombinase/integrase [Nitratireductor sp.]
MRHYRKVDPDRYLLPRRGIYYYWRRIPAVVAGMDSRGRLVRVSLKTDDLAEARAKRDALEAADNDYWQALILDEDEAKARLRYKAAVRRAEALGFSYRTSSELASGSLAELIKHVLAIPPAGAPPEVEAAVLGREERPRDSWWQAYEIYKNEIKKEELAKKSPGQLKRWENTRKAAISNFLKLVGEKPIADTTRNDGVALHKYWLGRVVPDDKTKKRYSPNSANKQIGILGNIYSEYFKRQQEDRKNPFSDLSFKERGGQRRKPFTAEWIQSAILAPGALAGMNDEGRGITLAQVETGCRPGELCNIVPEDILLDAEVPHIHVRARSDPNDTRDIKTEQSDRRIPLVGVALEVFKRHPKGFPRYKDKEDSYSAMANKYLKENGLRPSRQHTVYSFRHSFEDRMLEGGIDLELREVLMGHKLERPLYGEKGTLQFRQKVLGAIALEFDPAIV